MRRFAEIDENNIVTRVLIADDEIWLAENLGGSWVETFNDGTRGVRASAGYRYDSEIDRFIPPAPFASWSLNDEYVWQPPIPEPAGVYYAEWRESIEDWFVIEDAPPKTDGSYRWDEEAAAWVEVSGA